jgi:hypothetical protein
MVFILDEGSEFDAPLSKVWALANTEGAHNHPSQINTTMSMEGEHVILSFGSKMPDGTVANQKMRVTALPPVGFVLETIEGPLAGTKLIQYYVPKGNKTEIRVVGDATSKMPMPDDMLRGAVLQALGVAFSEDVENLKHMQ